jgi:hypothetical protein
MPTPEELEKLNADYRLIYDSLLQEGMAEDNAYQQVFGEQSSEAAAQQSLAQQAQMEEAARTGNMGEIPQEVREVLDLDSPTSTFKPFSQFMPGFDPVVPEDRAPLPPAAFSLRGKNIYDPERMDKLEQQAMDTAVQYYVGQGFPLYRDAQEQAVKDFAAKYGTREEFVANDPMGLGLTNAGGRYDLMFSIAQNPPAGS